VYLNTLLLNQIVQSFTVVPGSAIKTDFLNAKICYLRSLKVLLSQKRGRSKLVSNDFLDFCTIVNDFR
jgi:hypothetical protein